jgi:hypothetical protein
MVAAPRIAQVDLHGPLAADEQVDDQRVDHRDQVALRERLYSQAQPATHALAKVALEQGGHRVAAAVQGRHTLEAHAVGADGASQQGDLEAQARRALADACRQDGEQQEASQP